MGKRRTSLTDVARAAGVGIATASRALTGSAEVGAATRARILETAAELGYRPSSAAQALRTGRTRVIQLVVFGQLAEPVVGGLFEACEARGYHLLLTGPSSASAPAVDARILLDPDTGAGALDVEEPTVALRTGALGAGDIASAARAVVDDLVERVEGTRV